MFGPDLSFAETIPSETENDNPNGFPIAITFSPISISFERVNSKKESCGGIFISTYNSSNDYFESCSADEYSVSEMSGKVAGYEILRKGSGE